MSEAKSHFPPLPASPIAPIVVPRRAEVVSRAASIDQPGQAGDAPLNDGRYFPLDPPLADATQRRIAELEERLRRLREGT